MERRSFLKRIFGAAVVAPALPAIIAEATKPTTLPLAVVEAGKVLVIENAGRVTWMSLAEYEAQKKWMEQLERAYWYGTATHNEINKMEGVYAAISDNK